MNCFLFKDGFLRAKIGDGENAINKVTALEATNFSQIAAEELVGYAYC